MELGLPTEPGREVGVCFLCQARAGRSGWADPRGSGANVAEGEGGREDGGGGPVGRIDPWSRGARAVVTCAACGGAAGRRTRLAI